jgi:hypothetical protein
MRRHRAKRRGCARRRHPARVAVIDAAGRALAPCAPARARQLVKRGRAWFLTTDPPLIQLVRRVAPETPPPR